MDFAITDEEFVAIKAMRPEYQWKRAGDMMIMAYGDRGHKDKIAKHMGQFIYTRHVHVGRDQVKRTKWRAPTLDVLFTDEMIEIKLNT